MCIEANLGTTNSLKKKKGSMPQSGIKVKLCVQSKAQVPKESREFEDLDDWDLPVKPLKILPYSQTGRKPALF